MQTQKYNLNREVPLDDQDRAQEEELLCLQPSAEAVYEAKEEWDHLARGLSPVEVYMLHRLRRGDTQEQIAHNLNISERSMRRFMEKLKKRAGHRL